MNPHHAPQDGWIRQLREYLHESGVLVVMAGRDHLRWPDDWSEKDADGRVLWLEEMCVDGLSERDALEFLHRSDVTNWPEQPFLMPESLQHAILRVTNEAQDREKPSQHHCYLLEMCAEIVANTRKETGDYPPASVFAAIPPGLLAAGPLADRFLMSLHNQAMVGWLEELSLTPRFNEEFALALDTERHHANGQGGWRRLREFSFVAERADGFLELHQLLRESLAARIASDTTVKVHRWAYDQWSDQTGNDDWARRGLAWHHQRFLDRDAALGEFEALADRMRVSADSLAQRRLTEWWRDVELSDSPTTAYEVADQCAFGTILQMLSTGDRAANLRQEIVCCEAALRVYIEAAFPAGWAITQMNLGLTYEEMNDVSNACQAFAQAVRGYLLVGDEGAASEMEAHRAARCSVLGLKSNSYEQKKGARFGHRRRCIHQRKRRLSMPPERCKTTGEPCGQTAGALV